MISARRVKGAKASKPPFDRSVFVNCPFDDDFLPLLHARRVWLDSGATALLSESPPAWKQANALQA